MEIPEYTPIELAVMQLLAHGHTRETIAGKVRVRTGSATAPVSPSTVARAARSAAAKAGVERTIHAVAVMVCQGVIDVDCGSQSRTGPGAAEAWLAMKAMSALDWREFQDIRHAYTAMKTEGEEP